DAEFRHDS
nr:Chain P, abeta 1-8 peptide [synthetic construct]2IPU_Q Chain Q, abeta 1-8 peptide [synthetic construct]2R0W_Q Chain Q, Amyloid beta peptide fragment [synthetic construct]3JQ5_B Chain B, Amyloid Beta Peptide [synthetic construct]4OJF_A Chain A, Amyloid beta A4 protein [Homo sapiens]